MTLSPLAQLTSGYGQNWRPGILTEHLMQVEASGLAVRVAASGANWVHDPRTTEPAVPLVCSELVKVWTEDGPISGRCGAQVYGDAGACVGHTYAIESWAAQTEAETIAWERQMEVA